MSQIVENYPDLQQIHNPLGHKFRKTIALWSTLLFNGSILSYLIVGIRSNGLVFDSTIARYAYSLRSPLATYVFEIVTMFGYSILVVLIILLVLYLIVLRNYATALWVACTTALGGQFNSALKLLILRPRPQQMPLLPENGYSFPSGHAMAAIILYGLILYLILIVYSRYFSSHLKVAISTLCVSLIFLVGVSRVYLGVHYSSDVLGGYAAGCLWLSVAIYIHQQIIKKLPIKSRINNRE